MKSTTLFKIAGEVMDIARRHGIEIGDDGLEPGAIIERVREEIFERGRSYRDDLRRLRRLADELASDGEDDHGRSVASNGAGVSTSGTEALS